MIAKINLSRRMLNAIFFGLVFFIAIHFESLSVGSIKISHIWKTALLFVLFLLVFSKRRFRIFIYSPLVIFAFLQLSNYEIAYAPLNALFLFAVAMLFALIGIYIENVKTEKLEFAIVFISIFFVASFIPYELGLLESLGKQYSLAAYGSESKGIIGPFQGAHAASTALASSLLVLFYFFLKRKYNRLMILSALIFGIYFLASTYVRTGYVMLVMGLVAMLLTIPKKKITNYRSVLISFGIVVTSIYFIAANNQTLIDRISGNRLYSQEDSFESLGSGRGLLYATSIKIFEEMTFVEKMIGIGQSQIPVRMQLKTGYDLLPHNGFLQILLCNGIFGLLVFLYFLLRALFVVIRSNSEYKALAISTFVSYLIMVFFQSYDLLYSVLLMLISTSLAARKHKPNTEFSRHG